MGPVVIQNQCPRTALYSAQLFSGIRSFLFSICPLHPCAWGEIQLADLAQPPSQTCVQYAGGQAGVPLVVPSSEKGGEKELVFRQSLFCGSLCTGRQFLHQTRNLRHSGASLWRRSKFRFRFSSLQLQEIRSRLRARNCCGSSGLQLQCLHHKPQRHRICERAGKIEKYASCAISGIHRNQGLLRVPHAFHQGKIHQGGSGKSHRETGKG